jgi:hypothetical protein
MKNIRLASLLSIFSTVLFITGCLLGGGSSRTGATGIKTQCKTGETYFSGDKKCHNFVCKNGQEIGYTDTKTKNVGCVDPKNTTTTTTTTASGGDTTCTTCCAYSYTKGQSYGDACKAKCDADHSAFCPRANTYFVFSLTNIKNEMAMGGNHWDAGFFTFSGKLMLKVSSATATDPWTMVDVIWDPYIWIMDNNKFAVMPVPSDGSKTPYWSDKNTALDAALSGKTGTIISATCDTVKPVQGNNLTTYLSGAATYLPLVYTDSLNSKPILYKYYGANGYCACQYFRDDTCTYTDYDNNSIDFYHAQGPKDNVYDCRVNACNITVEWTE